MSKSDPVFSILSSRVCVCVCVCFVVLCCFVLFCVCLRLCLYLCPAPKRKNGSLKKDELRWGRCFHHQAPDVVRPRRGHGTVRPDVVSFNTVAACRSGGLVGVFWPVESDRIEGVADSNEGDSYWWGAFCPLEVKDSYLVANSLEGQETPLVWRRRFPCAMVKRPVPLLGEGSLRTLARNR